MTILPDSANDQHSAPDRLSEAFFTGGGEMGALMRSLDWSRTLLGPARDWPQSLRTAVSICLDSRFAIVLWWGPDLVLLYNDAYRQILQDKHPSALGQNGRECWQEIWEIIGPMLDGVVQRGEATRSDDLMLPLNRQGHVEECYFTFSYSPIRDETGAVAGIFTPVSETTERVIGERRLRTLRDLAARSMEAQEVDDACRLAAETLAANPFDLPFALLYLVEETRGPLDERGVPPDVAVMTARLAGASGLAAGTPASPKTVVLPAASGAAGRENGWPLAEVAQTGLARVVDDVQARFGGLPGGAWPEAPRSAAVLPVVLPGQTLPALLLVAGVSPRKPLDGSYRTFLDLVTGQIATAVANARAREEERKQAEALAALDRAKTIFFSNISHEFRTPLTLLLGPIEDALRSAVPALRGEDLQTAYRNTLRLLRLVNTLLDFSRIEAGRIDAVYEPVDLAAVTADLASVFRSAIERAGLRFAVACAAPAAPVYVDRDMWEKIVLNLLSNALKFTFDGEIAVALRETGGGVELSVRDTGTGIPLEEQPRLFERFHRVRDARSRTQEGTGIGLALVEELVRLHGGRIRVESRPGAGSTFFVWIPAGSDHLPPDRVGASRTLASTSTGAAVYVEEALRWLPEGPPAPAAADGPREDTGPLSDRPAQTAAAAGVERRSARVLIVDDNRDMRDYLRRLLDPVAVTETAANGAEALALVQQRTPDLVLSDVMMPELDGFALLQRLRADPATSSVPVILLSARAGEESRVDGLDAGADDYLIKPFSARELVARVRSHLDLAQLRRELAAVREQALAQAAAERERLYDVFMQAPAIICFFRGPDLTIEFANPRYLSLFPTRQMLRKPVRAALPEVEGQGFFEQLDQVYATGEPYTGSEIGRRVDWAGDGQVSERFFDVVYQAVREPDGSIGGVLVHALDVTERVRARGEREQFLATVSHDLKNPVTAIKGTAQLLARQARSGQTADPNRLLEGLEAIDKTSTLLTAMLDELIELTRLQSGESVALDRQPVDLVALVRQSLERYQASTDRHRFSLSLELPHDPAAGPPVLTGNWDAERLTRVLGNLISNAVKYSPDGGDIEIQLSETSGPAGRTAAVTITDYGIGIPEAELPRVFERFHRGSNVGGLAGNGLGLFGARQIVEAHGGRVEVRSREGRGSSFTTWLPLDAPPP